MAKRMLQVVAGCAGALLLTLSGGYAAAAAADPPEEPTPRLLVEHDGPEPAIWAIPIDDPGNAFVLVDRGSMGLTGVWGLAVGSDDVGNDVIYWTHQYSSGPNAGKPMLFSWDGFTGWANEVELVDTSSQPVEISSLGWLGEGDDGVLFGTGPDHGWAEFDRSGTIVEMHVSTDGNNENSGLTPQDPVRDISKGIELLRDWHLPNPNVDQVFLLLKRGDRWEEAIEWPPQLSGHSAERPVVVGSYGEGDRPQLVSKGTDQLSSIYTVIHGEASNANPGENIAFTDLHFIAEDVNRDDAEGIVLRGTWRNVLIENCLFEGGFEKNIVVEGVDANRASNITVRRSVIVDANSTYPSHASGMFFQRLDGLLIEECIFDNNGWNNPDEAIVPRTISGTTADGGPTWITLAGEAKDKYAQDLRLTLDGQTHRSVAASYGTHGVVPSETGSTWTIRLADSAHPANDFYNTATITVETNQRTIVAYDGPTRVATVDQQWPSEIAELAQYEIDGPMVPRLEVSQTFDQTPGPAAQYTLSHFYGNQFKHNLYVQYNTTDVELRSNIVTRGSSHGIQARSGGLIENNLFLENSLGLLVGYSNVQGVGTTRNNVVLGAEDFWPPTVAADPNRGQGIVFDALDGVDVYGNIVAHHGGGSTWNIYAFEYTGQGQGAGGIAGTRVFQNRVWDWYSLDAGHWTERGFAMHITPTQSYYHGLDFLHNHFQQPRGNEILFNYSPCLASIGNITWRENRYWLPTGGQSNLCDWLTNCNTTENCLDHIAEIVYTDPERDIDKYMDDVVGGGGGLQKFMKEARKQERGNWDERFTAHAVLNYVREGFDMPPLPGRSRRILYEIDPATGVATPVDGWDHYDFSGIEVDAATAKIYGISTRRHATHPLTALYLIDPTLGPQEIGQGGIGAREMEGLAVHDGALYVTSGEDQDIRIYDLDTGSLLGTIPTPISVSAQTDHHLGGTYGGAAILWFPWPQ